MSTQQVMLEKVGKRILTVRVGAVLSTLMLINVSAMLLHSMISMCMYQRLQDMCNLLITSLNGDMFKGNCSHLPGVHGLFLRLLCIFLSFV